MLVTIHNLTTNCLSCAVGQIDPGATRSLNMTPDQLYRASDGLQQLETAGYCTVVLTEELSHSEVAGVATILPDASATLRGRYRLVFGGTNEEDKLFLCVKADDGTYVWRLVMLTSVD